MVGFRVVPRFILAVIPIVGVPLSMMAQAPTGPTWDSYTRALPVIRQAIEASGGAERLSKLDDVSMTITGRMHMINQSLSPDGPLAIEQYNAKLLMDLRNNRSWRQQESRYPVDFVFGFQQVTKANEGFVIDLTLNNFGPEFIPLDKDGVATARARDAREIPLLLLRQASERVATLRSLGTRMEGDNKQEIIAFSQPDGTEVTLTFDGKTHLLAKVEILQDNGVNGDEVLSSGFSDYRPVNKILFPHRRIDSRNGTLFRELAYEVNLDTHPADALFDLPKGYVAPSTSAEKPAVELAHNVYRIQSNNSLAVLFKDYVFVVEAPNASRDSEAAIATIRSLAPGKPIRYLTVTHHHEDHAGGARPFMAIGATIVTTPENRRFFERMASASHTIRPDELTKKPRPPWIETFEKKRVFSDGEQTLELYSIGPNSHVNEMVLAYLPNQRLLYQGDALILPNSGHDIPKATRLTAEVATKIKELGLQPAIITDVHGRVATADDYRESLRKAGITPQF